MEKSTKNRGAASNSVRIIGGTWRSRKITFPSIPGLRPTADRLRETLFNWLGSRVVEARCLDLFAGSGAIGFEALSRGAAHLDLVESHPQACKALRQSIDALKAGSAHLHCHDAINWLGQWHNDKPYNLVFLDPPFASDVLQQVLSIIEQKKAVASESMIYIEASSDGQQQLPAYAELWREKVTSGVRCQLWRVV